MNAASGSDTWLAGLRNRCSVIASTPYAGAEVDAVQVELENLFLGELCLDEEGEARFLHFPAVTFDVREKERPGQLLRQRAAALDSSAVPDVAHHGAREPDRIDARMMVEPPILDRDDGMLQIRGDVVERHVVALLVEAEPRLAVCAVEHRVADAAREPVHGHRVPRQPHGGDAGRHDQPEQQRERDPLGESTRPEQVQERSPFFSIISE